MEMTKSGRGLQEDEEDDEEDYLPRKSGSSQKDGKSVDHGANTPRSKHSATEQRRRSKINERFQILRDLIPQNDQKRDRASFLLEVIEHVQFLQEKVNRFEASASYQGWNHEPMKLTPWRNGHGTGENRVDHSLSINNDPGPATMFTGKFDDNNIATVLANTHNPVESDPSTGASYKEMDDHPGLGSKAMPLPVSLQTHTFTTIGRSSGVAEPLQRAISNADVALQPQTQLWHGRPSATECLGPNDMLNEQAEHTIEGGTVSIAGVYSQGLLNNLTQALQSSGVDLSQASISVQVDIGKRALNKLTTMTCGSKDHEYPSSNRAMTHSRVTSSGEDSDPAPKRFKIQ